jgi:hypothetical protein
MSLAVYEPLACEDLSFVVSVFAIFYNASGKLKLPSASLFRLIGFAR